MIYPPITDQRISTISQKVVQAAEATLGDKLDKVILYGSYARGDFDNESDIDFLVTAHIPQEEAPAQDRALSKHLSRLDLEYDIIISYSVTSSQLFSQYVNDLPFFRSVHNEGLILYG